MGYRKGTAVWVEDKDHAWVEAEVIQSSDKSVSVLTTDGRKVLLFIRFCFLKISFMLGW
jgi:Myosin N-terminal SH3-like domain